MTQRRKHYSGEEKVSILRRHLLEGVPVSDVCDCGRPGANIPSSDKAASATFALNPAA